jgi:heptaprenyl diphosphate synthase
MSDTRKLVFFSLLVAMATALHVAETMLPNPFPLPGVKLGLANIVTLITLYFFGFRDGLAVAMVRVAMGSLVSGTFLSPAFILGLTGAVTSTLVMAFLLEFCKSFSVIGVSVAGAVSHNTGQIFAAFLLIRNKTIFFYFPFLLLAGMVTGLFTGYLLRILLERLEKSGIFERSVEEGNRFHKGQVSTKNFS